MTTSKAQSPVFVSSKAFPAVEQGRSHLGGELGGAGLKTVLAGDFGVALPDVEVLGFGSFDEAPNLFQSADRGDHFLSALAPDVPEREAAGSGEGGAGGEGFGLCDGLGELERDEPGAGERRRRAGDAAGHLCLEGLFGAVLAGAEEERWVGGVGHSVVFGVSLTQRRGGAEGSGEKSLTLSG